MSTTTWDKINLWIEPGKLHYVVVFYEHDATRQALLKEHSEPIIQLTKEEPLKHLLDTLTTLNQQSPRPRCVQITRWENLLDGKEGNADLNRLNMLRESFPSQLKFALIFWLHKRYIAQFSRYAPDLWSWMHKIDATEELSEENKTKIQDFESSPPLLHSHDKDYFERIQEITTYLEQQELSLDIELMLRLELAEKYLKSAQYDNAVQECTSSIQRLINKQNDDLKAKFLNICGLAYARLGEVEKAIDYYQHALDISREIKDRQGEGSHLGNLGSAYARLGEVEKAIDYYQQALDISREIKDRQGEGSDLGNLGSAYYRLGEVEKAIDYHRQALDISREIKDRQSESSDLGNLGLAYARLGEVEKAIDYYQQALDISREIKHRQGEGNSLGNLGSAYYRLGEVEKAIDYCQQALVIFEEIKSPNAQIVRDSINEIQQRKKHDQ